MLRLCSIHLKVVFTVSVLVIILYNYLKYTLGMSHIPQKSMSLMSAGSGTGLLLILPGNECMCVKCVSVCMYVPITMLMGHTFILMLHKNVHNPQNDFLLIVDDWWHKIVTLNTRGLRNITKMTEVMIWLRLKEANIFLQQTHTTSESEYAWRQEWPGLLFFRDSMRYLSAVKI